MKVENGNVNLALAEVERMKSSVPFKNVKNERRSLLASEGMSAANLTSMG